MFIRNDSNATYVRLFHASPDAPPVDIYINNNLVFRSLAFGNFTEYVPLSMGNYKIEVYPEGEKGKYNLAIWSKGKYSYSLYFSNGITEKEFKNHYFMKIL